MNRFKTKLDGLGYELKKSRVEILQVNLGKLCNLSCIHCHVESGPSKTKENMDERTAQELVRCMDLWPWTTLDLTGGAPELNPNFCYLVKEAYKRGIKIIDRCNLTVLLEPNLLGMAQFLHDHQVEIIASLPCYTQDNVDAQRGKGTFWDSIKVLQQLNSLGYGINGSGLMLNLVYNPLGPNLPGAQDQLEQDYKKEMKEKHGIIFNRLFTITNMPITRWAKYLKAHNQFESYQELLFSHFNSQTLDSLMCHNTLSVGYDGRLYDCDFNQMVKMQMINKEPLTIFNLDLKKLTGLPILTADHCFGCTAGCGSSCQGALKG